MPKCPKCNSSGKLSKVIGKERIAKCWKCDQVYWKHLVDCKCKLCNCDMCSLQLVNILLPEINTLDQCPDCGKKWN